MKKSKLILDDYEVDYEGAREEAEKIAQSIVKKHPSLDYEIQTRYDEGVFVKFYGLSEAKAEKIIDTKTLRKQQLDLILKGKPIYLVYIGPKKTD